MKTLTITAYTPLKLVGVEIFLGWIAKPFGPQRGRATPHFSERETFVIEIGKSASSLLIAPLTVICVDAQNTHPVHPSLQVDERGRIHIDADALIAQNGLPMDLPGLMKIEMQDHSQPRDDVVYEYRSPSQMEANVLDHVNKMAALSAHPEIVALREAQEAAGVYGKDDGLAAMRGAYARLTTQQQQQPPITFQS